jgi:predicted lipoprotein with Yx(FWY)xxD motif
MVAVATLVAGAVFGAACGDDDDGDDGGTTPAAATSTPAAAEPTEEATEPAGEATEPASGEGATVNMTEDATLGAILVGPDGLTLYTFTNDTPGSGTSACSGGCATNWPPLTVDGEPSAGDGVTGALATIERDDGTTQVTYDGAPLYYFAGDSAPGDTNGEGVGNIWFVATP